MDKELKKILSDISPQQKEGWEKFISEKVQITIKEAEDFLKSLEQEDSTDFL